MGVGWWLKGQLRRWGGGAIAIAAGNRERRRRALAAANSGCENAKLTFLPSAARPRMRAAIEPATAADAARASLYTVVGMCSRRQTSSSPPGSEGGGAFIGVWGGGAVEAGPLY